MNEQNKSDAPVVGREFGDELLDELVYHRAQVLAVTAIDEAVGTSVTASTASTGAFSRGLLTPADETRREQSHYTAGVLVRLAASAGLTLPAEEELAERTQAMLRDQVLKINPYDPTTLTLGNEHTRARLILDYLDRPEGDSNGDGNAA